MSIAWMTRVWTSAEPTEAADRLMLLALADNANDAGVCWPSVATLAKKCATTTRTVLRTLDRLEAAGRIVRERTPGKHNTYRLLGVRKVKGGDVGVTGDADDTSDVGDTGTGDAGDTGAVTRTSPEPKGTVSRTGSSNAGAHARASVDAAAARSEREGGKADLPNAVMDLTERGVAYGTAVRLVDVHGAWAVLDVCARFDREPGHSPGWLVAALREGYRTAAPDATGGDGAEAEPKPVAPILLWHQVQTAMRREDVPVTAFERVDDGPDGAPRWRRRAGVAEPTKGATLYRVRGGEG